MFLTTILAKQRAIVEVTSFKTVPVKRYQNSFFAQTLAFFYNNNEVNKNLSVNQALIDKTFATDDSHTSHNKLIDCNRK